MKIREMFQVVTIPVALASLCCLGPVMLVTLGISTVSFASSLADSLYGTYKWLFRSIGLIALVISLILYFRKKHGICTLDQMQRKKNFMINTISLTIIISVLMYVLFLYIVVHYWGAWLNIWTS